MTLAVIPFSRFDDEDIPLSNEKTALLKDGIRDGILEIALHGSTHLNNSCNENPSEFSGLDYSTQFYMLNKARKSLESLLSYPITLFIPPWNSYDVQTLKALEDSGFQTISAEKNSPWNEAVSLNSIPATCSLSELKRGLFAARLLANHKPIMVVLLHPFDFLGLREGDGTLTMQDLSKSLDWLAKQKDVRVVTFDEVINITHPTSPYFYTFIDLPILNNFVLSMP